MVREFFYFKKLLFKNKIEKRNEFFEIKPSMNSGKREKRECTICLEVGGAITFGCSHRYHGKCLQEWLKTRMNGNLSLVCCEPDCEHEFSRNDLNQLLIGDFRSRIDNYLSRRVISTLSIRKCPYEDCEFAWEDESKNESKIIWCMKCSREFCGECNQHHKGTCQEERERQRDKAEMNISELKNLNIKPCPNCGFGIQKDYGCDHMTCQKCKFEFWWSTGKEYIVPTWEDIDDGKVPFETFTEEVKRNQPSIPVPGVLVPTISSSILSSISHSLSSSISHPLSIPSSISHPLSIPPPLPPRKKPLYLFKEPQIPLKPVQHRVEAMWEKKLEHKSTKELELLMKFHLGYAPIFYDRKAYMKQVIHSLTYFSSVSKDNRDKYPLWI